jgi:hypothetical protein
MFDYKRERVRGKGISKNVMEELAKIREGFTAHKSTLNSFLSDFMLDD